MKRNNNLALVSTALAGLVVISPAYGQDGEKTLSCSVIGQEVNVNGFGESRTRERSEDYTARISGGVATLETARMGEVELDGETTRYVGSTTRTLTNGGQITYTFIINRSTGRMTVQLRMTRQPPIRGSWDFRWDASGSCQLNGAPRF